MMEDKKNPVLDPERNRGLHLYAGLIVALSIVFVAFEWTTEKTVKEFAGRGEPVPWEEPPVQIILPESEPVPPAPRVSRVKIPVPVFREPEVVPEAKPALEIPYDPGPEFIIPDMPVDSVTELIMPGDLADIPPVFPGGPAAMQHFIVKYLKYPEVMRREGLEQLVYVEFIISENGKVEAIKSSHGPVAMTAEVERVLGLMPAWSPGFHQGKPVRTLLVLPVKFSLKP